MLFVRDAIDNQLKLFRSVTLAICELAQSELVPLMLEVVWVFDDVCEIFDNPALLWLAAHVEDDMAAPHVVLYRDWCVTTLEKHQPVKACCVISKVLVRDRVSHIRHF